MHKDLIKWFFNENGLDRGAAPPSAAQEHFHIRLLLENISFEDILDGPVVKGMPEREQALLAEKEEIESAADVDQLIRIMRRGADIMNQQALVRRALDFADEIIPVVIKMLKTSMNELFIELSTRILAVCDMDISEELIRVYEEVRSPFAKSMILVALGFKAGEKRIPWIMKRYKELRLSHPGEDYCYGAYYALLEMERRFYLEDEKFRMEANLGSKT